MRPRARKLLFVLTLLVILVAIPPIAGTVLRIRAAVVLDRTLRALADDRRIPTDVRLHFSGIEVRLLEPGKLSETMRMGYKVPGRLPIWDIFPRRRHSFLLDTTADIGLACDVCAADEGWEVGCGTGVYEAGHVERRKHVIYTTGPVEVR